MSKEIELKIQITDQQLKLLRDWLSQNAQFKGQVHHIEHYLNNPKQTFFYTHKLGYKDAADFLRVRFSDKGDSVCLKRFNIDQEANTSQNIGEDETEVANGKAMLEILRGLGYTEETIVDKVREKFVAGNYEIVIDQVRDLGVFVEVELIQHDDDMQAGWKELKQFLTDIGITTYKEARRGYTSMLWNPNYDFLDQR